MAFYVGQVFITEGNLGPIVNICAILFLSLALLSFLGRLFTKVAFVQSLSLDDGLAFLAVVSTMISRLSEDKLNLSRFLLVPKLLQ